jgi:hypothetical protein
MPVWGDRAVVLGASMRGLLAARVLADFFRTVTAFERDELSDDPVNRRGVPQGRHVHALLMRGAHILDELFPGQAAQDWTAPILDVEAALRESSKRWQVREIACDPARWARTYQILAEERLPVVEYPQSPSRMTPATQRFYEAVMNRGLTHL